MMSSRATAPPHPTERSSFAPVRAVHRWLSIGLSAAAGCLFLSLDGGLTDLSYDLSYLLRPAAAPPDEAVLILMDRQSFADLRQDPNTPWNRALHAELIDFLTSCDARAVVIDSTFTKAGSQPHQIEEDRRLADAAGRNGRVFVAADIIHAGTHDLSASGTSVIPPFPALRERLLGFGPVNTWGRAARSAFLEFDQPSLPRQVASYFLGGPVDSTERPCWIQHYGPAETLPWYSYSRVLRKEVPSKVFSQRLVFIGVDHRGIPAVDTPDLWETPFSRLEGRHSVPGVEVVATACLNLIRNEVLYRLSGLLELLFIIVLGGAPAWVAAVLPPIRALAFAVCAACVVAIVGASSVWWTQVWFPWAIVAFVQIPLGIVWMIVARIDERSARSSGPGAQAIESPRSLHPAATGCRQGESNLGPPDTLRPIGFDSATPDSPSLEREHHPSPSISNLPAQHSPPDVADYELLRVIGRGGCGEVWLGRDTIGRFRAVKLVRRAYWTESPSYHREIEGIRRYAPVSLSHPRLLPILHVGPKEPGEFFYYVMELADDARSGDQIDANQYRPRSLAADLDETGRMPLADCLRLAEELADALQVLHSHQLIHRDIKPANVIFVRGACRLADIGLVTSLNSSHSGNTYVGTPGYIAPEGPRGPPADIFSLGKLMYAVATGLPVDTFPELPDWLPDHKDHQLYWSLNSIILRCCEIHPQERFASAGEIRDALRALRANTTGIESE